MSNICETYYGLIRRIINFIYPPFHKYMTIQFFRYGITGSMNLVLDWVLYFVIYNFVLRQKMLELGIVTISSHIATLGIKFPIILIYGFLIHRNVTFSQSIIHGRIQLFRYILVVITNLSINYAGLKLLVDYFGFYPTPSNMIVTVLTIVISYLSQKYFTFKISNVPISNIGETRKSID